MNKTPTFNDFWRIYPLKKGKEDAEKKAWNRLTAAEKRKAVAAVPLYIQDCQRNGIDRYKYPQGWLNGKRWRDYEEEPKVSGFRFQVSNSKGRDAIAGQQTKEQCQEEVPATAAAKTATSGPATLPDGMEKW